MAFYILTIFLGASCHNGKLTFEISIKFPMFLYTVGPTQRKKFNPLTGEFFTLFGTKTDSRQKWLRMKENLCSKLLLDFFPLFSL